MWKPMNQADMLYEKFKVWRLWHYQEISRCLYHMTKSIMYFQKECDQEQNEKPVPTNLFSLSPSHLQSSAMEINPVWVLLIIIYKSFFKFHVFFPTVTLLLCFLIFVPFSSLGNLCFSHLRIPLASLHISYLFLHDFILFTFLLCFEMCLPLELSGY